MRLIPDGRNKRIATECLLAQPKLWFLSGATFVIIPSNKNHWQTSVLATTGQNNAQAATNLHHVFCGYRTRLGRICGLTGHSKRGQTEKYVVPDYKTRIELRAQDPLLVLSLVDVFFYNPRYHQHIVTFRAPARIAPIPKEIRAEPSYLMTGENLFVGYKPVWKEQPTTPFEAGSRPDDLIVFATQADMWKQTVGPTWLVRKLMRRLSL